jgi:hypothetical protein
MTTLLSLGEALLLDVEQSISLMLESFGMEVGNPAPTDRHHPPRGAAALPQAGGSSPDPEPDTGPLRWSWLPFRGAGVQGLAVGASPRALTRLTTAMTGLPASQQDGDLHNDVVNEVANILGGNLYPVIEGTTGLGLPSPTPPENLPKGATVISPLLGGGHLEIRLILSTKPT